MKKFIVLIISVVLGLSGYAQKVSAPMEKAVAACTLLSKAIGSTNTSSLKAANKQLREADIVPFKDLWIAGGKDISVDGHFIFDEEFVDSLVSNRAVIKFSSKYAEKRTSRGSTGKPGRIKMTTKALKAGASAVWKTVNRKNVEYALVAEPGGLFTMTIKDEKGNILYSETKDNKKGAAVRKASFTLPDKSTRILIEVKNNGKSDASFALLSN